MKKYVFLAILFSISTVSFQAKERVNNYSVVLDYRNDTEYFVPKAAKRYVKKNFPEAYDIKWNYKKSEALYKSEFKVKGEKYKLIFTPKGKLIYYKGNIAPSELPSNIKRYIKKYYSGYQISRVEKTKSFSNVVYNVKIRGQNYGKLKNRTIKFDQKGNILN